MVGALQYFTFRRPDIAFVVNHVCQYMHTPTDVHLAVVKRILRYVCGTIDHGFLYKSEDLHLTIYIDADWAGDSTDRRFTFGICIFMQRNKLQYLDLPQKQSIEQCHSQLQSWHGLESMTELHSTCTRKPPEAKKKNY